MKKVEIIDGKKPCSKCGEVKPIAEFNKNRRSTNGLQSPCRACKSGGYRENVAEIRAKQKQYYVDNRERICARVNAYRLEHFEEIRAKKKKDHEANREKDLARSKRHYEANREKMLAIQKEYRKENREKVCASKRKQLKRRRREDPNFRLVGALRCGLYRLLNGGEKYNGEALVLLGCTITELRAHLEAQFTEGMSWETHCYKGWHIHHIRPLSKFDPTNPEQRAQACHFTNLQPLWWWDNFKKGDTWEPEEEMAVA